MHKRYRGFYLLFIALLVFAGSSSAQRILISPAQQVQLRTLSAGFNTRYQQNHQVALQLAKTYGWPLVKATPQGGIMLLSGVNSLGFPVYLTTYDNVIAAATTQTNTVQPGGVLGLNLSGSGAFLNDKLAIWDGGEVYSAHQEFAGKIITLEDNASVIDHATHVAGTMIAKGVYLRAKGMAFGATTLHSYYFDNDAAKMASAAPGLLLSNHSYGDEAGWNFNGTDNRWEWYGLPGDTADYNFGFYGSRTQQWDQIAYNAPYYLIVESAGNSHAYPGPDVGQDYYGYQSITNQTIVDKGPRPAGISNNTGYDVISTTGNAKNILTVGAVNPLPFGPASASDITIAPFSSWGPTDDGRIKPDVVGDGVDVTSAGSGGPSQYITLSGTSMSAPNVTGSLYLLQEYYAQNHSGDFMRAATLKGLVCHTAFDAGNPGPDYIFGWGLLDMKKAAQAITDNGRKSLIKEATLQQGQQQTYHVIASGNGLLAATISWTDPPGAATKDGTLNNPAPKLVNDLDIRISDGSHIFYPWVLNPAKPSARATNGDNILDNIEQVIVPGAVPGKTYTITVSQKGTLQGGPQDYAIIATGIGGAAYCASAPLSDADSRIDKVSFSNLNYTAPAGCTTYTDQTGTTVQLEQGKAYKLSLTLGTCGANFNKAAKVYIDWNGDGIFEPADLVATTGIVNGTAAFISNVTVPASVIPGNYSLMRIVLTETSDTSAISPCGSYAKGETQDYRVQFLPTSTDAGITSIMSPDTADACPASVPVTVVIKNFGAKPVSNIPVSVSITGQGYTTTLKQNYIPVLKPLEEEAFTLDSSFTAAAGAKYAITASTNLAGDEIAANDTASENITIHSAPAASALSAYYCTETKRYELSGTGDGEMLWYQSAADTTPVAFGNPAQVSIAAPRNTWYAGLNDFRGTIGPASKYAFSGGGYNQFTPYVNISTRIPVIIKSARMYIGNPGRITFEIDDSNGEVVSSTTIFAAATRAVSGPGAQADDPTDKGAVYPLNLLLPAAGAYTLNVIYNDTATIYRSNAGVTGYPFKIGNVFSIDGNNATSGTDTTYYRGFYYYLYDIKLQSPGCSSANRQAVSLSRAIITQSGANLVSNFTAGNQWYLDNNAIQGATGQTYTPQMSGNYTVGVTLDSGCTLKSDNFVYIPEQSLYNNSIALTLYPVPADNQLNIIFKSAVNGEMTISLTDAGGKIVYSNTEQVASGNISTSINVSAMPPGNYIFNLSLGGKVYHQKLVIAR